jgi:RNase P/RNase MRP subunit p29
VSEMDEEGKDSLASYLKDADVKVVWREEERTKVGRGKIVKDDENFVVLTGEKGTVIVSKKDIIAIKQ